MFQNAGVRNSQVKTCSRTSRCGGMRGQRSRNWFAQFGTRSGRGVGVDTKVACAQDLKNMLDNQAKEVDGTGQA